MLKAPGIAKRTEEPLTAWKLQTSPYVEQKSGWPQEGRCILAQYDRNSIIVYQAYRPTIGRVAAAQCHFPGEFSFRRMSWIKTSFLWMMYRSGWGTKPGQEVTLAIRVKRSFFDTVLARAVASGYDDRLYRDAAEWRGDLSASEVRLQWDPDRHPSGARVERRAIQLGLRGRCLREYADDAILDIDDISPFVAAQRVHVELREYAKLLTPTEWVYPPPGPEVAARLGIPANGTEA